MIILGICPRCGEPRVRSLRDLTPGSPLDPNDFDGVGDHPAPEPGQPMTCANCNTALVFRRDPASPAPVPTRPDSAIPALTPNGHAPTTTTLFAADTGEDIVSMRTLSASRMLIQTTRRLVLIDLALALTESPDA